MSHKPLRAVGDKPSALSEKALFNATENFFSPQWLPFLNHKIVPHEPGGLPNSSANRGPALKTSSVLISRSLPASSAARHPKPVPFLQDSATAEPVHGVTLQDTQDRPGIAAWRARCVSREIQNPPGSLLDTPPQALATCLSPHLGSSFSSLNAVSYGFRHVLETSSVFMQRDFFQLFCPETSKVKKFHLHFCHHISPPRPSCPHLSMCGFIFTRTYTAGLIYCQRFPEDLRRSIPALVDRSGSAPPAVR